MHRQLGERLRFGADARHVVEIQLWINALGEQVHRHRHQIAVAGAFAVAEQGAFHALGAGHQRQLGGRYAGAAVVMGMQAHHHAVAARELAAEPLDLVRIDVGRGHLHRGRQVDDHLLVRRRAPRFGHRGANVHGEIQLGAGEALRRVFERHLGAGERREAIPRQLRPIHRQLDDAVPPHAEHHAALQRGGGVVEVEDRRRGAFKGFHGALDELLPRLAQHLNGDVRRNAALVDDAANEVEVRLRGGRETHFDLLEADVEQQVPHAELLADVHRVDQGLVAIPQINAAPARRRGEHRVGPSAVLERNRREGAVLAVRHGGDAGTGHADIELGGAWGGHWLRCHGYPLDLGCRCLGRGGRRALVGSDMPATPAGAATGKRGALGVERPFGNALYRASGPCPAFSAFRLRCPQRIQITAAMRPVTPSRRCEKNRASPALHRPLRTTFRTPRPVSRAAT